MMIDTPPKVSRDELVAFAALYVMLAQAGVVWRLAFAPDGAGGYAGVSVEVQVPGKNVTVEARDLPEAVAKLGSALVAAAMEGAPES